MGEQFVGSLIAIHSKSKPGSYEGIVLEVNKDTQSVTVSYPTVDGRPTGVQEMEFGASDIEKIEVVHYTTKVSAAHDASCFEETEERPTTARETPSKHSATKHEDTPTKNKMPVVHDYKATKEANLNENSAMKALSSDDCPTNNPDVDDHLRMKMDILRKEPKNDNVSDGLQDFLATAALSKVKISAPLIATPAKPNQAAIVVPPTVPASPKMPQPAAAQSHAAAISEMPHSKQDMRKKKKEKQRTLNDNTFGNQLLDADLDEDFDFESNLALFDKKATAAEVDQLRSNDHHQPDVVSQTTKNRTFKTDQDITVKAPSNNNEQSRQTNQPEVPTKYRCDENVIPSNVTAVTHIVLPSDQVTEVIYATDSGFLVPGVSKTLRNELLSKAVQKGFTTSRQLEVTGRAAAELSLQLLGGDHRVNSRNSHQLPRVVVLCGCHQQGALGLNTARQLLTHDIITTVVTPSINNSASCSMPFNLEMKLYEQSGGSILTNTSTIDSGVYVDMILDARLDHDGSIGTGGLDWVRIVSGWARGKRCPVLSLDPPAHEVAQKFPLSARALVVAALPLVYAPQQGLVHLVKMALPPTLYKEVGIEYKSPFQAKFMLSLHPCD